MVQPDSAGGHRVLARGPLAGLAAAWVLAFFLLAAAPPRPGVAAVPSALDCPGGPLPARRFIVTVTSLESGDRCRFAAASIPAIGEELGVILRATQPVPMHSILREPAARHGAPFAFVAAVMMAESGGDPFAVGDNGSSVGLFQLHEAGLGAAVPQLREDPSVSAGIAAGALAEGWNEGVRRGLSGDALVRFAYGYIYNPGGEYQLQGDKIAAYYRYYSGRPRALGDPDLPRDGVVEDAAEVNVDGVAYFVLAQRRESVAADDRSLENVVVTVPDLGRAAGQHAGASDGDWLLVVAVATPTLVAIALWALRHRTAPRPDDSEPATEPTA